jgi:hypothetical protein
VQVAKRNNTIMSNSIFFYFCNHPFEIVCAIFAAIPFTLLVPFYRKNCTILSLLSHLESIHNEYKQNAKIIKMMHQQLLSTASSSSIIVDIAAIEDAEVPVRRRVVSSSISFSVVIAAANSSALGVTF